MEPGVLIIGAFAYAPFVAIIGRAGGGVWKVLTFALCTAALTAEMHSATSAGIVAWGLACLTAVAADTGSRREARDVAALKAIKEQNEILRGDGFRRDATPVQPKSP